MKRLTAILFFLLILSGCDMGLNGSHYIIQPYDGEGISANTVSIVVVLPDNLFNTGVDRVEFYINSNLINTIQAPGPYDYEWDTSTLTNGPCTIMIKAIPLSIDVDSIVTDSITVYIQH